MVNAPMEIKHIHHKTTHKAIKQIADDTRIKKKLRDEPRPTDAKDRLPFPEENCQRQQGKDRQGPYMPLEHAPGATAILHIGQLEQILQNHTWRCLA